MCNKNKKKTKKKKKKLNAKWKMLRHWLSLHSEVYYLARNYLKETAAHDVIMKHARAHIYMKIYTYIWVCIKEPCKKIY